MAAEHLLNEHRMRRDPTPSEHRSPQLFKETVDLVIAFGTPALRGALREVRPLQYRVPAYPHDDALAQLIEIVSGFAAGQPLDVEACRSVEARCEADQASRWDRLFYLPYARAVRAAAEGDAAAWNGAIALLIKAQEDEAKRGEYKRMPNGLMCLPGLAVAKLGIERGLTCNTNSDYLPLALLEEAA
jgi:hypothetical protein